MFNKPTEERYKLLVSIFISLLSFFVYMLLLDRRGLWSDEIAVAIADLSRPGSWASSPFDVIIRRPLIALFGASDFMFRIPSAIAGAATVFLTVRLGNLLNFNKFQYTIWAVASALSPFVFWYSTEGRYYIFVYMTVLLVIHSFEIFRTIEAPKLRHYIYLAMVSAGPGFISSVYIWVGPVILLCFYVLDSNVRKRTSWKAFSYLGILIVIIGAIASSYSAYCIFISFSGGTITGAVERRLNSLGFWLWYQLLVQSIAPFSIGLRSSHSFGMELVIAASTLCGLIIMLFKHPRFASSLLISLCIISVGIALLMLNRLYANIRYFCPIAVFTNIFLTYGITFFTLSCITSLKQKNVLRFATSACILAISLITVGYGLYFAFNQGTAHMGNQIRINQALLASYPKVTAIIPKGSSATGTWEWYEEVLSDEEGFELAVIDQTTTEAIREFALSHPDTLVTFASGKYMTNTDKALINSFETLCRTQNRAGFANDLSGFYFYFTDASLFSNDKSTSPAQNLHKMYHSIWKHPDTSTNYRTFAAHELVRRKKEITDQTIQNDFPAIRDSLIEGNIPVLIVKGLNSAEEDIDLIHEHVVRLANEPKMLSYKAELIGEFVIRSMKETKTTHTLPLWELAYKRYLEENTTPTASVLKCAKTIETLTTKTATIQEPKQQPSSSKND